MQRSTKKQDDQKIEHVGPMFIILLCGLILIFIAIYFMVTGDYAGSTSLPGRTGRGAGRSLLLTGPSILVLGLAICAFPAYQFLKRPKGN